MPNKRIDKFVLLASWVACIAFVLVLAISASAQERIEKLGGTVSPAQLDLAMQRAYPERIAAIPASATPTVGRSGMEHGAAARSVEMSDIPQRTTRSEIPGLSDGGRPLSGLREDEYQALKRLVAQRAALGQVGSKPSSLALKGGSLKAIPREMRLQSASPTPSAALSNAGFYYGQTENGWNPPDMGLAVSENFVVQVVNAAIAVYSKSGALQSGFPKDADTFFGAPANTFIFDPRAFYDWANHRFFILMDSFSNSGGGSLYFAISKTQDPRGGWWIYHITPPRMGAGVCGDFPTLGHDTTNWGTGATKGGIYIGVNIWPTSTDCGGASFSSNVIYLMPKDPLYNGSGFSYWYTGQFSYGSAVDTLQPVNVTDRAEKPNSVFFVNSLNYNFGNGVCSAGCSNLILWAASGPTSGAVIAPHNVFAFLQGGNGPTFTSKVLTTSHTYAFPVNAAQPGCVASSGGCVDTDYTFISGQVKYHAGEIFGSFNTSVAVSPAVTGPIWFDIHPMTDDNSQLTNAVIRQEDCFVCGGWGGNHGSAYYADLQPDQENNVVMIYNFSDDVTYPRSMLTSRRATFPDSLMDGVGAYFSAGTPGYKAGRWGDYTATAPDFTIATRGLLWMSGEYATSSGWGTIIGWTQYLTAADQ